MKRRSFLKTASAFSVPIFVNGTSMMALPKTKLFGNVADDTDRVLVLIQLNGGNDALNTIIPMESYDNLVAVRPSVVLPDNALLDLTATSKMHPGLVEFNQRYQEGMVSVIQSVGYPNQNRSHFRSTDIWVTGSHADEIIDTGWVGRYLDSEIEDYPHGYPNDDYPDPFALTIGNFVSQTCQGSAANYSLAIASADDNLDLSGGIGETPMDGSKFAKELDFLKIAIEQTNKYGQSIKDAAGAGNSLALYPESRLAQQLKSIATLISGGLKTKVYVVQLGGFDTHANQVDADPTAGRHNNLMVTLSQAIHAFLEDLNLLGLEKRVIGMTFSEFGRRIVSNLSQGTDHGDAGHSFVFGHCVKGGVLGDDPVIAQEVQPNEGLPMQYDFRSVYGSILIDWFGVSTNTVKDLLFEDFQHLPLIEGCDPISAVADPVQVPLSVYNFPNPFVNRTRIVFDLIESLPVKVSIFDTEGRELLILVHKTLSGGHHEIPMDASNLRPGSYYFRVQAGNSQKVGAMIKVG